MSTYDTLPEALEALRQFEVSENVRFAVQKAPKGFGTRDIKKARKVFWEDKPNVSRGSQRFNGTPFVTLGQKMYECQFGKDRHKKSKEKRQNTQEAQDHHYTRGQKFLCQPSKKLGCPATVVIRELVRFPTYKVDDANVSKSTRRNIEEDILCRISQGYDLENRPQYVLCVPNADAHVGHPVGEVGQPQQIDRNLKEKIKELADTVTTVQAMRKHLNAYVKDICQPLPHPSNPRFYPSDKIIGNRIYTARREIISNQQEVLFSWNFLFVYQNTQQKRLLERYGSLVIMDSTYRTSVFDLALFFLVVKTNVDFQIAATFMLPNETIVDIAEALNLLRQEAPDWKPVSFLTDFDEAEIGAIKSSFPESKTFLCSFHREQAWERWTSLSSNGVQDADSVKHLLRNVANARDEDAVHIAIDALKQSIHWQENERLRDYMDNVWLPIKEKWCSAYRSGHSELVTATTNGVETQHKILKTTYLNHKTTHSLPSVVKSIVTEFLPDRYTKYIELNNKFSCKYRPYSKDVPVFLHDRPRPFVKHCMERLESAKLMPSEIITQRTSEGTFQVLSCIVVLGDTATYPSCTCYDWRHNRMPCKHMMASLMVNGQPQWQRLSPMYTHSPLVTLDEEVLHVAPSITGTNSQIVTPAATITNPENVCAETLLMDTIDDTHPTTVDLVACPTNEETIHSVDPCVVSEVSAQPGSPEKGHRAVRLQKSWRIQLKQLTNLSYRLHDIEDLNTGDIALRNLLNRFNKGPHKLPKIIPLRRRKRLKPRRVGVCANRAKRHNVTSRRDDNLEGDVQMDGVFDIPETTQPETCTGNGVCHSTMNVCTSTVDVCTSTVDVCTSTVNVCPSLTDTCSPAVDEGLNKNKASKVDQARLEAIWACGHGAEMIVRVGPYMLSRNSFQLLKTTLPDEIMDAYLMKLCECNHFTHVSCVVATAIMDNGRAGYLRELNFKNSDGIVCAVNECGNHWVLMVIELRRKIILYVNPLGELTHTKNRHLKRWLTFLKERNSAVQHDAVSCEGWVIQTRHHSKQMDSDSCGVHVLKFAENYLQGKSLVLRWNAGDINRMRYTIGTYLLQIGAVSQDSQQNDIDVPVSVPKKPRLGLSLRKNRTLKRMSSFVYPPVTRGQTLHCICQVKNDGRTYWMCEKCQRWYHPSCLGLQEEDEPKKFVCPSCT